jgi:GGDEF domain-containing protein
MKMLSRHNEGVMMVTQNNDLGTLSVVGMNDNLLELLGYDTIEEDSDLIQFLGASAKKIIRDDVEFEEDSKDLLEVLRTHRQMRLLKADGNEINMDFRIMRSMAQDRHHLFRIIFITPSFSAESNQLNDVLRDNFAGYEVLDAETGLPDAASLRKYLELAEHHIGKRDIQSCFVYMKFEDFNEEIKLSKLHNVNILQHVSRVIKRNLREEDVVGRIADDALGIILVDVNKDTVHLALNRIKHMIHHDPVTLSNNKMHIPLLRQSCAFLIGSNHEALIAKAKQGLIDDADRDIVICS